ncbi:MAG: tetratricopeptide repeat protein [Nannocystaceae bacterium]
MLNARSNRAEVLLLLGRTDEALTELRELSNRWPESANTRDGIATALRLQGDFAAAFREDLGLLRLCESAVRCEFWVFLGVGEDLLGLDNPGIAASVWFERARLGGDRPPAGLASARALARDWPRPRRNRGRARSAPRRWRCSIPGRCGSVCATPGCSSGPVGWPRSAATTRIGAATAAAARAVASTMQIDVAPAAQAEQPCRWCACPAWRATRRASRARR